MDQRELLSLLRAGESDRVEFKRTASSDIGAEICALANTRGGVILIGVEDDGSVVGCDPREAKRRVSQFAGSVVPPPRLQFETVRLGGYEVLAVRVAKTRSLCSIGGVAYLRVGTSKRPLSIQEILALGVEELLFQLDRLPTDAPARELSMKYVRWFGERRRSRGLERTDVKRLIRTLGAITRKNGRSVLSLGGLLFFHPRPQDYLPHAAIRVIRSDRWKRFEGPVWSAVDEALAHIVAGLSTASLVVGARREDYPEYPPRALREALVNAVVHRNYSISSEVFVRIENDKLSISNPGGFPPGTSVENPRPVPRNPLLYELMFQAGYVERQGRGIRLIQEECEKHPFVCVEFRTGPDFTEVIFHKKPAELDDLETRLLAVLRGRELPSSALARELGTSKVTVLRRLKRLEAMGLVRARGRGAQRRYFTVNRA